MRSRNVHSCLEDLLLFLGGGLEERRQSRLCGSDGRTGRSSDERSGVLGEQFQPF